MNEPSEDISTPVPNVYNVEVSDPHARLIDRGTQTGADVAQISEVMAALAELRSVERQLSEASQRYMQLGETDMKALHFLIAGVHTNTLVTPSALAEYLNISTASTTKLLDRLETGGHILRKPHPTDRRARAVVITESTYEAAMETIGKQQAKRFHAAARLTSSEREIVIRFLTEMAEDITLADGQWDNQSHS